jgi:hypothetical protein
MPDLQVPDPCEPVTHVTSEHSEANAVHFPRFSLENKGVVS